LQSCTLDTNSLTSRMQAGQMTGSTLPSVLSATNTSAHTHNPMMWKTRKATEMGGRLIWCVIILFMRANTEFGFQETTTNIFDNIPALARPKRSNLLDELTRYLNADSEYVEDVLAWCGWPWII